MKQFLSIALIVFSMIFVFQSCVEEEILREKPCQEGIPAKGDQALGDMDQGIDKDLIVRYENSEGQMVTETVGSVNIQDFCGGFYIRFNIHNDCWSVSSSSAWYGNSLDNLIEIEGNYLQFPANNGTAPAYINFPYDPNWFCGDMIYLSLNVQLRNSCTDVCGESNTTTELHLKTECLLFEDNSSAGQLDLNIVGDNLMATFTAESSWKIQDIRLHIGDVWQDIPHTVIRPLHENFDYQSGPLQKVSTYTFTIPLSEIDAGAGEELSVAARLDMINEDDVYIDLDAFADALPSSVTMKVKYPYNGGPSLFITTTTGGTVLDGQYKGWCVDLDRVIYNNKTYTAKVYSTFESAANGFVEKPQNYDIINWIINANYVGRSSMGHGNFTYGDVQRAIWHFIEDQQSTNGLGSWNQYRVDQIIFEATRKGEGFTPKCDDKVALLLVPVNTGGSTIAQITVIEVLLTDIGMDCGSHEIAWAGCDLEYPTEEWARYFKLTFPDDDCTVSAWALGNPFIDFQISEEHGYFFEYTIECE